MIHVTFSSSGAGCLRQALSELNQSTPVVDLCDDLSWGAIASGDFAEREAWLNLNLPLDQRSFDGESWSWLVKSAQEFQSQLERHKDHLVWVAPQNIVELCGLHWYLDRWSGHNASFILVEDALPGGNLGQPPSGLGQLGPEDFTWLLEKADRQLWDEKRFQQARWRQLCQEATNLRTIRNGTATSIAEDHFDALLLALCATDWNKLPRIIAEGMLALWEVGHHVGHTFVCWRLRELAAQGKIVANREITLDFFITEEPILVRRN
jgi:Protein of unknown function/Domain of unknown function (DUF1835)